MVGGGSNYYSVDIASGCTGSGSAALQVDISSEGRAFWTDDLTIEIFDQSALEAPEATQLPAEYALHPAHPNPFNPLATIRYELPVRTEVTLTIYDILGREVARLVDGMQPTGHHQAIWNGQDHAGQAVPSGIYIAQLMTPGYTKSIKMVLLK